MMNVPVPASGKAFPSWLAKMRYSAPPVDCAWKET